MEWLNFRHLYSFWMVWRSGSFQNAAKEMYVSQSTVSEQVKSLEAYFQKDLFERSPRNLSLTNTGKELFVYADDIFTKSREINEFVKDEKSKEIDVSLNVGITGSISRNLLFRFFYNALEQVGISDFNIVGGQNDELVRSCEKFELDFFVSDEPPSGKDSLNLQTKILFRSSLILAGKKKILNQIQMGGGKVIDLFCFKHQLIDEFSLSELEKKLHVQFNKKLITDDISLLRFFANSGKGISLIPEIGVHEDLLQGLVEQIPLRDFKKINFYVNYGKKALRKSIVQEILSDESIKRTMKWT